MSATPKIASLNSGFSVREGTRSPSFGLPKIALCRRTLIEGKEARDLSTGETMRDITITSTDYAGAGSSDPQRLLRQILDCGATSTNRSRFFRVFGCETVGMLLNIL